MEPISIFLGALILFLTGFGFGVAFGFQWGYTSFQYENLKKSLSDFKKNTFQKLLPRQKVVILSSKEAYLPDMEDEGEDLLQEEPR